MMTGPLSKLAKLAGMLALAVALTACGDGGKEQADQHLKKGQSLAAEGKHEAAVGEFKKAAELNKDFVDAYIQLGSAYLALKKHDEAFAAFAAAKKADRASAKPYLASARARMALGQVAAAVADLDQVTELDPGNLEGMLLQGEASMMPQKQLDGSMSVGQVSLDRARLNLETVAQKTPDNIEAQYWLAKLYEKIGQKDKAIAAWGKVGELAKGKPDAAGTASEVAEALARLKR